MTNHPQKNEGPKTTLRKTIKESLTEILREQLEERREKSFLWDEILDLMTDRVMERLTEYQREQMREISREFRDRFADINEQISGGNSTARQSIPALQRQNEEETTSLSDRYEAYQAQANLYHEAYTYEDWTEKPYRGKDDRQSYLETLLKNKKTD